MVRPTQPKTSQVNNRKILLGVPAISLFVGTVHAQDVPPAGQLPVISVNAAAPGVGYATLPDYYRAGAAGVIPFRNEKIADAPASVTVIPEDLLVDQQASSVNEALRNLPSVIIRDQQGYEVSRPQARGFQGSIVQNTRLDGLAVIGTTAIPAENLSGIEVLNGLSGALYGPQPPAGVFNYVLRRPTDKPLNRFMFGYTSDSTFTEQADLGGRVGPAGNVGYRLNLVHGEGTSWAPDSHSNRTLFSGAFDFHLDRDTVIETDFSHYTTHITGLPGSVVFNSGKSTMLPSAIDPTRLGYGQPGAGANLTTNTAVVKLKHHFNDDWSIEVGGLYQNAERGLYGITHQFTDNLGDYRATRNFNAVPHFSIASNNVTLNGCFSLMGMRHDLVLGTNGFVNGQYSNRHSIATVLGTANVANPVVFPQQPMPSTGGQYRSSTVMEQSIVVGDTLHLNDRLAVQAVVSTSFLHQRSFGANGNVTSSDQHNGMVSPSLSVIYKPTPKLTAYATIASSVEQGDQAPVGTVNANQFMAPYHDREIEGGIKYAPSDSLLLGLSAFRMTRPLAATNAVTNVFSVIGQQANVGAEFFVQGDVTSELALFGGVTYIDARLNGTGHAATDGKRVVGVPNFKGDLAVDYHPRFAHGLALTGAAHFEGSRAATNTNNSIAPGYATFDLGLRYASNAFGHHETLRFQVINLTNTFYYASIADGNIVGSAGSNTAYVGTPRTFMATLELDY